ncbi:succinate dehydrogenase subunit C [Actinocorallia herbida]|uniref:Succinate dehydrogenase subunit C n=1 Tax=Actinocorallia herbida TaxID=58109 RepID=A0A3N1CQ59_9ACTN|nr:succinate dehydrogenase cytochrome b subunit [Actinocorallia herbida]ROO82858.1 succinate dehydrogenase subunit C [Actinocorallia herbida]
MAIASIPALYRSSVGKKAIMAVTGAFMVLFLIGHMVGNLKIFFGLEEFNGYAAWLRTIGEPALHHEWFLWILRLALVAAVVLHFSTAAELTVRAKRARPVKYQHRGPVNGSYAARTMRWGGVIVLLFIIWHILDLTVGVANPNGVHGEAYQNVVAGFAPDRWWVTAFYVVSMIMLGFHLRHGLVSAVQTLGLKNPKHDKTLNVVATGFAVLLSIGFLIVPISVTLGVVD